MAQPPQQSYDTLTLLDERENKIFNEMLLFIKSKVDQHFHMVIYGYKMVDVY